MRPSTLGTLGRRSLPFTSTSRRLGGVTPVIDKFVIIPVTACAFALILAPLLLLGIPADPGGTESRLENRIFWPAIAVISFLLTLQNGSGLSKCVRTPHIICLFVYLSFAGASVLWSFSPESSFVRYIQQVMIVISIVLPFMLASRTADILRCLFLCFALALIINLAFVLGGSVTLVKYGSTLVNIGYEGYFNQKNYLGEAAAAAFLLSLHEVAYRGWRRAFGVAFIAVSVTLIFLSESKTAVGLALICPILSQVTLTVRKITRISVAIILLCIPLSYVVLSNVSNFNLGRISYILYGDSTFTGRTIIWDFASYEIARSPLLGWGYQSFWLVPNSPSTAAPGWVKMMPNAHNGYYDTMLEMGYIGLACLLAFVVATLHAIGRVADRDPVRAWLVLSLALFIICYNYFESLWMRGFEFLWVVFVIIAAEIGRYWRPLPLRNVVYRSGRLLRPSSPGTSLAVQRGQSDIPRYHDTPPEGPRGSVR